MFTFLEFLAFVVSESSFSAYVCHRRSAGAPPWVAALVLQDVWPLSKKCSVDKDIINEVLRMEQSSKYPSMLAASSHMLRDVTHTDYFYNHAQDCTLQAQNRGGSGPQKSDNVVIMATGVERSQRACGNSNPTFVCWPKPGCILTSTCPPRSGFAWSDPVTLKLSCLFLIPSLSKVHTIFGCFCSQWMHPWVKP